MNALVVTALIAATFVAVCAAVPGCGHADDGDHAPSANPVATGAAPGPGSGDAYPQATEPLADGAVLPDLAWRGLDASGAPAAIAMHDYYEPRAERSRVLVVRVDGGAWCGTCRWHAAHTGDLMKLPEAARLRVLDLVVADADNAPAHPEDLPAWRSLVDAPSGIAFGADPSFRLRALGPDGGVLLPLYALVDTKTMRVHGVVSNPDPATLATRIATTVAELDGALPPPPVREALFDGIFHSNEWDMIRDVVTPAAPPADPTNAVADSAAAAALGKALFFDAGLSPNGAVSCATCHDPAKQLADGRATAMGLAAGSRKTPRIALAAFSRWQFWDGRADSLWSQALGPIENEKEIGGSRVGVVRRLVSEHASALAAAFPSLALPSPADLDRLPSAGKPGDAAYDALSAPDRDAVTRVFVAAGKAIAAYERTFRVQSNALDAYASGKLDALSTTEKQGLSLFARVGCMQCHWGPRLTDDAFHVTRVASGRADGSADPGRSEGIVELRASDFLGTGRWSDAPASGRAIRAGDAGGSSGDRALVGAFKTPSLRGIAVTGTASPLAGAGPFGHGGTEPTLVSVTESYGTGGAAISDPHATGDLEPWLIRFDVTAQWAIPPFLATLTAKPIVP